MRALSTLRGLRGTPEVPPLCRETQSLGQQMSNAPVGTNGLTYIIIPHPCIRCDAAQGDCLSCAQRPCLHGGTCLPHDKGGCHYLTHFQSYFDKDCKLYVYIYKNCKLSLSEYVWELVNGLRLPAIYVYIYKACKLYVYIYKICKLSLSKYVWKWVNLLRLHWLVPCMVTKWCQKNKWIHKAEKVVCMRACVSPMLVVTSIV